MTAEEIDFLAKKKQTLIQPNIIERDLWAALRDIYEAFDKGTIPVEGAKKAKADAVAEYNEYVRRRQIFLADAQKRIELAPLISKANIHGCDICKQIAAIYDGRSSAKA